MQKPMAINKRRFTSYNDLPLVLSVKDVMKVLGLSSSKTYNLINTEGFPKLQVGKRLIVPKEKFIEWIERNTL